MKGTRKEMFKRPAITVPQALLNLQEVLLLQHLLTTLYPIVYTMTHIETYISTCIVT